MKKTLLKAIVLCLGALLFSQEALKSVEEKYFDFLSLSGAADRPFLTYRTLSDSEWTVQEEDNDRDVWKENNTGTTFTLWQSDLQDKNFFTRGLFTGFSVKAFGPEIYNSYNTNAPFGKNDGALWQGRGYNMSLTTGVVAKGFGFTLVYKPQISFSQNKEFEIMPTGKTGDTYSGKADKWGYFWGNVDAPQRFGDSPFWVYDWGDSEIRWTWRSFTVGFGTQSPWVGPAFENPLLHSNNAPTYPKLDFGIKRTSLYFPHFGWYLGDLEMRIWYGYLSESDYFDNNTENDHNMIGGFSISYAPPFLPGLTLGATKICLSKWGEYTLTYMNPFWNLNTIGGGTGEDQKASIVADWHFPKIGLEVFGEIGIDDFLSKGFKFYEYARYPFHSMTYTVGLRKSMTISQKHSVYGLLEFEWDCTEMSDDFYLWHSYNFGFHHQITQGYTNRGQWLGSGIGYGGNQQYLSYTVYSKHGSEKIFVGRNNPDNNYIYAKVVNAVDGTDTLATLSQKYFTAFKANFFVGAEGTVFIQKDHQIRWGFTYDLIINPLYNPGLSSNGYYREYTYWHNFQFMLGYKFGI